MKTLMAIVLGVAYGLASAQQAVDPSTLDAEQSGHYAQGKELGERLNDDANSGRSGTREMLRRANQVITEAEAAPPIDSAAARREAVTRYGTRAEELAKSATPAERPDLKSLFAGMPFAQEAEKIAAQHMPQDMDGPQARYVLLVTRAMGANRLREALRLSQDRDDLVVAFRGPAKGQKVPEMVKELAALMSLTQDGKAPNVVIDPTKFDKPEPVAPVLIRLDDEGEVVAKVRGVLNPEWIEARVERGETGDLGRYGEIAVVSEVDMIELMQQQLADYDIEGRTRNAYKSYFARVKLPSLPHADATRERLWDPSVVLKEAITMPDGRVAAYPGTVINPMEAVGFAMTLVVFDAAEPSQVAWAADEIARRDGEKVYAIASNFDGERGWEGLGEVMTTLQARVFHTNQLLVDRFGLERVPALVSEGTGNKLLIREFDARAVKQRYPTRNEHGGSDNGTGSR